MASEEKFGKETTEIRSFLLKNVQHRDAEFKKISQSIKAFAPLPEPEGKIWFRLQ